MPAAKLCSSGTHNAMKSEEGSDSLDTFIRQAIGKEPLLPFRGPLIVQYSGFNLPGWPLMTPLKVQMQKCEKCSREFCSPINYRRHIRVHRRSLNVDKESHKNRDLLAAFWDKLSLEQVKDVVSFDDVMLKSEPIQYGGMEMILLVYRAGSMVSSQEIPGSSLARALASSLRKPGVWTLPQAYVKAGSALLDIIQAKPSRLPISSQELFSILDDASERTFLCAGTADSVQKYILMEKPKNSLELKNLVASTSFLFEQQLVKAWVADKDAEALRCQKLLVEEEEAAQKSDNVFVGFAFVEASLWSLESGDELAMIRTRNMGQDDLGSDATSLPEKGLEAGILWVFSTVALKLRQAVLLERKKQKKLRQKEQKVKEQFYGSNENLNVDVEAVDGPTSTEASGPSSPSDCNSNSPDVPINLDSSLESMQPQSKEPEEETEAHSNISSEHINLGDSQTIEPQMVGANGHRALVTNRWHASKSQRGSRYGFHVSPHLQTFKPETLHKTGPSKDRSLLNGSKVWTKKLKVDSDRESLKPPSLQGENGHQIEENKCEVIIGSISVALKNSVADQQDSRPDEAQDVSSTEHTMLKKKNTSEKLIKANSAQFGSSRGASKLWRPVIHGEVRSVSPVDRGNEDSAQSQSTDNDDFDNGSTIMYFQMKMLKGNVCLSPALLQKNFLHRGLNLLDALMFNKTRQLSIMYWNFTSVAITSLAEMFKASSLRSRRRV
ncbi:hypothetical protein Sango_2621200 [Sesamum angolense]|uniref:C2H2-type domain-containing protein n=1 Tax=Sesamum angolense TaxID=2727404 RepID=A0AAE1TBD0_9LAMI|nr:hypothetical protein Sango_2621200 [Sesamum angolense]